MTEPAAPSADVTSYVYDVAGRLVKTTQGGQSRTFLYDSFGFPLTESTPEAGMVDFQTTFGSTTYSDVGSLGNVRSRKEGGGTVSLAFTYDPAGRLKTQAAGGTTYVTNCWDGETTSPCVSAGGRIVAASSRSASGRTPASPRRSRTRSRTRGSEAG